MGNLNPNGRSIGRQIAYGKIFGALDLISFSLRSDRRSAYKPSDAVSVYPTNSFVSVCYGIDAYRIARTIDRPDVISAQDPFEAGLIGVFIARTLNIPLHIQVHTDFLSRGYREHSLLNRIRVVIAGFILRRATRVRVVSETIKNAIIERYGISAPITTLPIFVDVARFNSLMLDLDIAARFKDFTAKVLVVARLEPEKDVSRAICAFAEGAPADACLIVVGDGSERRMLEALAHTLHIEDRVFFEGEQDPAHYYPLADLVMVTSQYEGYGLVIVEALAAGRPVISTDVGVARDVGAIIADPDYFAETLSRVLKEKPRGVLTNMPYRNFDDYAQQYCADIMACVK